jgi:predicted MFS family arabinose efflux permease
MSALGAGALLGAVLIAFSRQTGPSRGRLLFGAIGIGVFLCLLALSRRYQTALVLLFFAGLSMISFAASTNATVQIESLDVYRGRVMSLYSLVLAGVSPIGAMFTGTVSDRFGAPLAIMLGGAAALIGVAIDLAWKRFERSSRTA